MTDVAAPRWTPPRGRGRTSEATARIGSGELVWRRATSELLRWAVKTRSGFSVADTAPVAEGRRVTVVAHVGPIRIVEPVQVMSVVAEESRVGFSYRTLPGHPVSGEEAFILHRDGEAVHLTVRSLARPAPQGPWRVAFPLLLIVQRIVRRRYLRALR
ncbi:DUF1990 family protein [Microbacterium sp. JZ31]|uniref:DUF1990 family protein n=1 Tax=Microbacterium sp. JZ31 TaxID=1906274 RepID=UPI0019318648|nr:DUF1990 domain-containing protein [Microbacterium sp. JZ31]